LKSLEKNGVSEGVRTIRQNKKKGGERMIYQGDCLDILPTIEANSIDSIVTDPPYGLSFMGKDWDYGVPGVHFWVEALRVAKPGAFLLAFGGTRTFHRLTVAIEDAGWEIRDCIGWLYGSGFPKSHNIGAGWGTALKPAWEPIIVARKPFTGTVANNVLKYGTGAMNIDGCRVDSKPRLTGTRNPLASSGSGNCYLGSDGKNQMAYDANPPAGRWPANLIHDGSDEVVGLFPVTTSGKPCGKRSVAGFATAIEHGTDLMGFGDSGSAARFFKSCTWEPDEFDDLMDVIGLESDENLTKDAQELKKALLLHASNNTRFFYCAKASKQDRDEGNGHPTVKPTALMRYLCRLVTPPGGTILDPFMGSGSTGKAAVMEGFRFIGIELESDYTEIAGRRISAVQPLFDGI
jgi:site-specific DNA-methyltransferase (adenine-specific)